MGCNSSKSQDIQQDRKRLQTVPVAVTASPHPARTKPMGIGSVSSRIDEAIEQANNVYGTSYTDKRLEESDFLKNILEKTQSYGDDW